MKVIDCIWEIPNLGCRVAEVSLENEIICKQEVLEIERKFDYVVIKTEVGNLQQYKELNDMGYSLAEAQMSFCKPEKEFILKDKILNRLFLDIEISLVTQKEELLFILNNMSPDMFSTDRIFLDPFFGADFSLRRYRNWIKNEYNNNSSKLLEIKYRGESIGFDLIKKEDGVLHGLLGGIYKQYQDNGLGFAIILAIYAYIESNKDIKIFKTKISSNNIEILKLYNYLNFRILNIQYVFYKHTK